MKTTKKSNPGKISKGRDNYPFLFNWPDLRGKSEGELAEIIRLASARTNVCGIKYHTQNLCFDNSRGEIVIGSYVPVLLSEERVAEIASKYGIALPLD
jgi:hypothetical protein